MDKLPQQLTASLDDDHLRSLAWMERSNADVLVRSAELPGGYVVPAHSHRRAQFLCVVTGVVVVATMRGRWMIPPGHALLIPRGLDHSVEMYSDVTMRSVYVFSAEGLAGSPEPTVLEVTALARHLLDEAVRSPTDDGDARRAELVMALLMDEIGRLSARPLGLPFPAHPRLAALCRAFVDGPAADAKIDDWARQLAMSRRSFTRLFREETGVSFSTWRQQAAIFACLPKLAGGMPVTQVALEAGYDSVPAFTTMFRRMLGTPPKLYFRSREAS